MLQVLLSWLAFRELFKDGSFDSVVIGQRRTTNDCSSSMSCVSALRSSFGVIGPHANMYWLSVANAVNLSFSNTKCLLSFLTIVVQNNACTSLCIRAM